MGCFGVKACALFIKRTNLCKFLWLESVLKDGGSLKSYQERLMFRRYLAVAAFSTPTRPQVEVSDATYRHLRPYGLNLSTFLCADDCPLELSNGLVSSHGDSLIQLTCITPEIFSKRVSEQYQDGRYRYLVKDLIATPEVLYAAYIKMTEVAKTSSTIDDAQMALDGIGPEWFICTAKQLREGTFNIEEHCQELTPRRAETNNLHLRLPNLKLKVVLEALRSILQEIYDPLFSNMSHGYRVGRGRHTAIRNVKSLSKGASWWISFDLCKKFDLENFRVLISALEERIQDRHLFDLLSQLQKSGVLQLDIGGHVGEFSQERILSPMVLNIYFDNLDKEVIQICETLDPVNSNEKLQKDFGTSWTSMIQKDKTMVCLDGPPAVKLVYFRYVDEILLAVVGPKQLASSIKDKVTTFLQSKLHVEITPARSMLIYANSGKVEFLGMDLQFVSVMKLPHVKTEKEIAALNKAKHRIKAVALQRRLRWETQLRKMGNKALTRIVRKSMSQDSGNKLVDTKVMDMFESVSREAVKQFLNTKEDREVWHEKLARGDALLSPLIRKELPQELVDSYDEFRRKAAKYLATPPSKVTTQEPRKVEPAKLSFEAFTKPENKLQIYAPIDQLIEKLRFRGVIDKGGRPVHLNVLLSQEDPAIIQWYGNLAFALLDYYRCCDNFTIVKEKVDYHLRRSCLRTLAAKHKLTIYDVVTKFSDELSNYFPSKQMLYSMSKKFLTDPNPYDDILFLILTKISNQNIHSKICAIIGCCSSKVDLYLIRIQRIDPTFFNTSSKAQLPYLGFDRREVPLCKEHHINICSGKINLHDIRIDTNGWCT